MQRKQVKTAAHRVKSSARRSVGKMTGNKDMEKQGKVEKAVAGARKFFADVRESARRHAEEEVQ
jgi:uncharacterized protein YjbJ (UPF0337 family)